MEDDSVYFAFLFKVDYNLPFYTVFPSPSVALSLSLCHATMAWFSHQEQVNRWMTCSESHLDFTTYEETIVLTSPSLPVSLVMTSPCW